MSYFDLTIFIFLCFIHGLFCYCHYFYMIIVESGRHFVSEQLIFTIFSIFAMDKICLITYYPLSFQSECAAFLISKAAVSSHPTFILTLNRKSSHFTDVCHKRLPNCLTKS